MQRKMLALWQQQLNGFHFVCSPARCKTLETREPFFAACIGRARGADVRIFHIPKSLICYAFLPCHSRHTRSCQSFELVIISSSSGAFFPFFFCTQAQIGNFELETLKAGREGFGFEPEFQFGSGLGSQSPSPSPAPTQHTYVRGCDKATEKLKLLPFAKVASARRR